MRNNPIVLNDPTGHRACGDGEAIDCETGLLNNPSDHTSHPNIGCGGLNRNSCLGKTPRPKHRSGAHAGGSANQNPLLDLLENYDYAVNTKQIPYYQSHNFTHDIDITGQYGGVYSNGSDTTISLYPPAIRQTLGKTESGLAPNFTWDAAQNFTTGYGQSLPGEVMSSLTGFNLNPITGTLSSRVTVSSGPFTITSSMAVQATFRPAETLGKATAVLGGIAAAAYFSAPTPEKVVIPAYAACKAAGLCP